MMMARNYTNTEMADIHSAYNSADDNTTNMLSLSRMVPPLQHAPREYIQQDSSASQRHYSIWIESNKPREAAISEYSSFGGKDVAPHGTETWDQYEDYHHKESPKHSYCILIIFKCSRPCPCFPTRAAFS
jgi:hypothetical protein